VGHAGVGERLDARRRGGIHPRRRVEPSD
jgi:hypothetical protein